MTKTTIAEKRAKLEVEVDSCHSWDLGQVSSSGGTKLHSTDRCSICGLERIYFSDTQNEVEGNFTFYVRGSLLSLKEAVERGC